MLQFGCMVNVMHNYAVEVTMCLGPSMLPTFNKKGDIVLLEHFSKFRRKIERGDVVVSKSPTNPRHTVCKRVLGMGGDIISVPTTGAMGGRKVVEVPPGHLWLQGDNTGNSTDSRDYGPVPYAMLRGRVFCKVWPPREAGWVERDMSRVRIVGGPALTAQSPEE